jgi:hypothetical protein
MPSVPLSRHLLLRAAETGEVVHVLDVSTAWWRVQRQLAGRQDEAQSGIRHGAKARTSAGSAVQWLHL